MVIVAVKGKVLSVRQGVDVGDPKNKRRERQVDRKCVDVDLYQVGQRFPVAVRLFNGHGDALKEGAVVTLEDCRLVAFVKDGRAGTFIFKE